MRILFSIFFLFTSSALACAPAKLSIKKDLNTYTDIVEAEQVADKYKTKPISLTIEGHVVWGVIHEVIIATSTLCGDDNGGN